jgi:hypothetical protein
MRSGRAWSVITGAVLAFAGISWALMGLGVTASRMTPGTLWAVIGSITAAAGLVLFAVALFKWR